MEHTIFTQAIIFSDQRKKELFWEVSGDCIIFYQHQVESLILYFWYGLPKAWTTFQIFSGENLPKHFANIRWVVVQVKNGDSFLIEVDMSVFPKGELLFDNQRLVALNLSDQDFILDAQPIRIQSFGKTSLQNERQIPDFFRKGMGWCTWNAYGHAVDEQSVIESVKSFRLFKPSWVLIDDGWLDCRGSIPDGQLYSFHANKQKFPNGLQGLKNQITAHLGEFKLGAWLTVNGYWMGIDPESPHFEKYKNEVVALPYRLPWTQNEPRAIYFPLGDENGCSIFWRNWLMELKSQGVDFLKVDHQNFIHYIMDNFPSLAEQVKKFWTQLQQLINETFGDGHLIHCMGMHPYLLQQNNKNGLYRITEDYFPAIDSYNLQGGNAASHVSNIIYHSLWAKEWVNPDGDMFQTTHSQWKLHLFVRLLLELPIYLTDRKMENEDEFMSFIHSFTDFKEGRHFSNFKLKEHSSGATLLFFEDAIAIFNLKDAEKVELNQEDLFLTGSEEWYPCIPESTKPVIEVQRFGFFLVRN